MWLLTTFRFQSTESESYTRGILISRHEAQQDDDWPTKNATSDKPNNFFLSYWRLLETLTWKAHIVLALLPPHFRPSCSQSWRRRPAHRVQYCESRMRNVLVCHITIKCTRSVMQIWWWRHLGSKLTFFFFFLASFIWRCCIVEVKFNFHDCLVMFLNWDNSTYVFVFMSLLTQPTTVISINKKNTMFLRDFSFLILLLE